MTLLERCEPIFVYVCKFNRKARTGVVQNADLIRQDVKQLLAEARAKGAKDPGAQSQGEKIEPVMGSFVDFSVSSKEREWSSLAAEMCRELAGDEKFFDLLEE